MGRADRPFGIVSIGAVMSDQRDDDGNETDDGEKENQAGEVWTQWLGNG